MGSRVQCKRTHLGPGTGWCIRWLPYLGCTPPGMSGIYANSFRGFACANYPSGMMYTSKTRSKTNTFGVHLIDRSFATLVVHTLPPRTNCVDEKSSRLPPLSPASHSLQPHRANCHSSSPFHTSLTSHSKTLLKGGVYASGTQSNRNRLSLKVRGVYAIPQLSYAPPEESSVYAESPT